MTKERLEMTKPSPSKVHFQREWRFLGEINYFCVMNQIPELQALLRAVEERFGEAVKTTAGFERLATSIDFTVGQTLGASTLKRLWGYIPEETTPRLSTLDILARSAGYKDFKAFRKTLHAEDSSDFVSERTCLTSADLADGDRVLISWAPNRLVTFRYRGNDLFEVVEAANAKLLPGDVIEVSCFFKGWPLFVPGIRRGNIITPPYIAGKAHGLSRLEKL